MTILSLKTSFKRRIRTIMFQSWIRIIVIASKKKLIQRKDKVRLTGQLMLSRLKTLRLKTSWLRVTLSLCYRLSDNSNWLSTFILTKCAKLSGETSFYRSKGALSQTQVSRALSLALQTLPLMPKLNFFWTKTRSRTETKAK